MVTVALTTCHCAKILSTIMVSLATLLNPNGRGCTDSRNNVVMMIAWRDAFSVM